MTSAFLVLLLLPAPSEDEVREAAGRVLEDDGYQTEIPDWTAPVRPRPPDGSRRDDSDPYRPPTDAAKAVASAVWWLVIGVVLALVVVWLVREFARGRSDIRAPPEVDAEPRKRPVARPALPDPEALAGAGRYADAVHAVLLRVIAALDLERPSWTSREVARRAELEPAARSALGHLVLAVEASLFGGRATDEAGYRACAEHGRTVLAALRRRA